VVSPIDPSVMTPPHHQQILFELSSTESNRLAKWKAARPGQKENKDSEHNALCVDQELPITEQKSPSHWLRLGNQLAGYLVPEPPISIDLFMFPRLVLLCFLLLGGFLNRLLAWQEATKHRKPKTDGKSESWCVAGCCISPQVRLCPSLFGRWINALWVSKRWSKKNKKENHIWKAVFPLSHNWAI